VSAAAGNNPPMDNSGRSGGNQSVGRHGVAEPSDLVELHRLCVFELDLTCGHCVTVSRNGWYPVSVACCDRLGGAWFHGTFYSFDSDVDHVRLLQEPYEYRLPAADREPMRLLDRRDRTDDPFIPNRAWQRGSVGRFPARVGGPVPDPRTAARS
jgi:hypothetical protein